MSGMHPVVFTNNDYHTDDSVLLWIIMKNPIIFTSAGVQTVFHENLCGSKVCLFRFDNSFFSIVGPLPWNKLRPSWNDLFVASQCLGKETFPFFHYKLVLFFPDGSSRSGLCSMYLNQATIGTTVNAFFRRFVSIVLAEFYYKVSNHRCFDKSNFSCYIYVLPVDQAKLYLLSQTCRFLLRKNVNSLI